MAAFPDYPYSNPMPKDQRILTMVQIVNTAERQGPSIFSDATVLMYSRKVSPKCYPTRGPAGTFLVTSENVYDLRTSTPQRRYSVRRAFFSGSVLAIQAMGDPHTYKSHSGAHRAAQRAQRHYLSRYVFD